MINSFHIFLFVAFLLSACKDNNDLPVQDPDQVLAIFESKKLRYEEIEQSIPQPLQGSDSAQFVNNYIDRWIKDQILIKDANAHLRDIKELNQLVDTYRDELMMVRYEEQLFRDKLDTTISDAELRQYYNSNKSKYKLESTIFRFVFLKINKPAADSKSLDQMWNNLNVSNTSQFKRYCDNNADLCFLDAKRWYKWEDINNLIPAKFLKEGDLQTKLKRDFADFNYEYKIHFFEVVKPNEDPPLSFVRDQATQAILHRRKINLLDNYRSELYEKELKNKKIQILNR